MHQAEAESLTQEQYGRHDTERRYHDVHNTPQRPSAGCPSTSHRHPRTPGEPGLATLSDKVVGVALMNCTEFDDEKPAYPRRQPKNGFVANSSALQGTPDG